MIIRHISYKLSITQRTYKNKVRNKKKGKEKKNWDNNERCLFFNVFWKKKD